MEYQLFKEDFEELAKMTEENLMLFSQHNNIEYNISKDIDLKKMIEYILSRDVDLKTQETIIKHFSNQDIETEEKSLLLVELSDMPKEHKVKIKFLIRNHLWVLLFSIYLFAQLIYLVSPTASYTISLIGVGFFLVTYDDSNTFIFKSRNKDKK
jgi:hypothetical protein